MWHYPFSFSSFWRGEYPLDRRLQSRNCYCHSVLRYCLQKHHSNQKLFDSEGDVPDPDCAVGSSTPGIA